MWAQLGNVGMKLVRLGEHWIQCREERISQAQPVGKRSRKRAFFLGQLPGQARPGGCRERPALQGGVCRTWHH